MDEPIREFKGEFAFLANDYPCKVTMHDSITYQSAEAAFQAMKTDDVELRRRLGRLLDAADAKKLGNSIRPRDHWEKTKYEYMRSVLSVKFGDDPLMERLDKTGDAVIINGNRNGDCEWGISGGKGDNLLGKCLMQVRDENRRFILHGKKV